MLPTSAADCITVSVGKLPDFVFIMTFQSPFDTCRKNTTLVYYMWTRMPITGTVSNGHFMMIQMYVLYQYTRPGDIYFPAQETSTKEARTQATGILLISLLM